MSKKTFKEQREWDYANSRESMSNNDRQKVKNKIRNRNFEIKEDSSVHRKSKYNAFMDEMEDQLESLSYIGNFRFK